MNPKDSRTAAQKSAMAKYVRDFHAKHPNVKIIGHRDLSPDLNGNGVIEPYEWMKPVRVSTLPHGSKKSA